MPSPRDGTYTLSVTRGRTQRIHSSLSLAAGPYSRTIELPATLLPGVYAVVLAPSAQLLNVLTAFRLVKLAAPAEGVVDKAFLSGARTGAAGPDR